MGRCGRLAVGLVAMMLAGCDTRGDTSAAMPQPTAMQPTGNAADAVFCPEIQRRTSRANCEDLTATADLAKDGVAAFNVPPLSRGRTVRLQLALGYRPAPPPVDVIENASGDAAMDNAADDAADAMATADNASDAATPTSVSPNVVGATPSRRPATVEETVESEEGPTRSYSPIVGRYMRAELVGSGFTITARSPASQEIFADSQTTWEWDVTPQRATSYALSIKTAVEGVTEAGDHYPLRSTVRNEAVEVTVPWHYRIWDGVVDAPAWLKTLTVLVGAVTALVTAIWALRRAIGGKKAKAD